MIKKISIFSFLIIILTGLTACTGTSAKPETIRIAVLPIFDTLPIYVAEQEGLFQKHNVAVETIPVSSAPRRDELINAGQADGMINDVVSTIFHNRAETRVQIVRYGLTPTEEAPIFYILAADKSDISTTEDLKEAPIGVSQGTIIEYLTDRLLQAEGLNKEEITTIAVPDIAQRMALLKSGELSAAMLPTPLSLMAKQQGNARIILTDAAHPEYSYSTLSFRKEFIDQNPEAVRGFLAAWEEAVQMINQNPNAYEKLMIDQKMLPPSLSGQIPVPSFVSASTPTQAQWDDVRAWVVEKGLDPGQATYEETVTTKYLPQ